MSGEASDDELPVPFPGWDEWLTWRVRPRIGPSDVTTTAQSLYRDLVNERLSPGFRSLGLQGSSGRYTIRCVRCWVQMALQKDDYSDAAEVRFTINLSVVNKSRWEELRAERPHFPPKPRPSVIYGPAPPMRIGFLLPDPGDIWWHVHDEPWVLDRVATDVLAKVRDYALPWLRAEMESQGCSQDTDR